jgi:hypothetical protein
VFDCAIASGCPVPDGRLISRIADEVADSPPDAFSPASAQAPAASRGLLELLTGVADGRPGQGRDHPVAALLALAAGAVAAGCRSFTAIAGWAADVPAGGVYLTARPTPPCFLAWGCASKPVPPFPQRNHPSSSERPAALGVYTALPARVIERDGQSAALPGIWDCCLRRASSGRR